LETARLAQVQRLLGDRMGRDVFFYSITIDPDHDTPAVLAEYAEKYHAAPGWLFLTGAKGDIELIGRKLGLYTGPDPRNPDGHVPYLLVGNQATGQWMRNSAVDNPKFIARTIGQWMNSWQTPPGDALKSYAEAPARTFDTGQYTFVYHCSACHAIGSGQARIGPDLAGVTSRRDRDWLRRFIAAPDKMNADGDPIAVALRAEYREARMPNLKLNDDDVSAVIDYLSRAGQEASPQPRAAATASPSHSVRWRRSIGCSGATPFRIRSTAKRCPTAAGLFDERVGTDVFLTRRGPTPAAQTRSRRKPLARIKNRTSPIRTWSGPPQGQLSATFCS